MKKILSLLGTITLIGTSTTSLVACNTPQEYTPEELEHLKKENQIDITNETIKNNLEWIAPQEKPFNKVDNKWYFVIWHGLFNNEWKINVFNNNAVQIQIDTTSDWLMKNFDDLQVGYGRSWKDWTNYPNYFKSVYRWNLDIQKPNLIIDKYGNVKINE